MFCTPGSKFAGIRAVPRGYEALAIPLSCNKWVCEKCGPKKQKKLFARMVNGGIALPIPGFRPQYTHKLLTLTCPGASYRAKHTPESAAQDMAKKFNKLTRAMKKRYGEFDYFRVVELQQDGFPHYHVILRGKAIVPKEILAAIRHYWTGLYGMGNVDIQKMKSRNPRGMVRYVLKYLSKSPAHLAHNKRLYTASRNALAPVFKEKSAWLGWRRLSAGNCHSLSEANTIVFAESPLAFCECEDLDIATLALDMKAAHLFGEDDLGGPEVGHA